MAGSSPPPSGQVSTSLTAQSRTVQRSSSKIETNSSTNIKKIPDLHSRVFAAPNPTRICFDPFNSSSTGHQQAENRLSGSTAWRVSRTQKLAYQLNDSSGRGGEGHRADLVGAGSKEWEAYVRGGGRGDESKRRREIEMNISKIQGLSKYIGTEKGDWEMGRIGVVNGEDGLKDIRHAFGEGLGILTSKKRKRAGDGLDERLHERNNSVSLNLTEKHTDEHEKGTTTQKDYQTAHHQADFDKIRFTTGKTSSTTSEDNSEAQLPPQIFAGLSIYLNGSTAPLISDLRLKQLFAQHGGTTSLNWAKKSVTHVILGESSTLDPDSGLKRSGAGGGGLASSKIQKEMKTVRGKSLKFVTASWVVDSVKNGKRLPEHNYISEEVWGRVAGLGSGYRGDKSSDRCESKNRKQSVLNWVQGARK